MAGRYFIRFRNEVTLHGVLVEMTAQEHRDEEAKAAPTGWPKYYRVPAEKAHRWVKDGSHHETGLYLDDRGRVRYASDGI